MTPEALDSLSLQELMALISALVEQNRLLVERNAGLDARIAELEARLGVPPKTPDKLLAAAEPGREGQPAGPAAEAASGPARRCP